MCGLVGIFGSKLSITNEKIFKDLLYLDVFRGEHSTGVAIVSQPFAPGSSEVVELVKTVGAAPELFNQHGKFQNKASLTAKSNLKLLLGHNRHATQGAISVDNAHPFELGNVVGAHNGTVLKSSLKGLHEADKFEVDSQMIYSHLGAGNTIESVWSSADGAMALTWYDKVSKKLNIIRNKERPLYVTATKDGKTMYWASEAWMLHVALSRNGVKDSEIEEVRPLPDNTHFQFAVGDDGLIVREENPVTPFVRKPVATTYYGTNTGFRSHRGGYYDDDDWLPPKVNRETQPTLYIDIREVVPNAQVPHAFGKTSSGEDVKIIFQPKNAKTLINNVLQRGIGKGAYVATKYLRLHSSVQGVPAITVQYSELKYFKKKGLTKGFGGEVLTSEQFANKVKCGCANCTQTPNWSNRDDIRWIEPNMFVCQDCRNFAWVDDLINQYAMNH